MRAANSRSWIGWLIATLSLLGLGAVIFRQFLFGNALLLYKDIGSDSLTSYYADFVHLSNYLRSDGFPSWSFHIGMGQDLSYALGFLVWEPVAYLPARLIAHALVYQHLFKVLVAGLLFYGFLNLRRVPLPVGLLGSLVIAFSAYMTMGSCWYLPAEELLAFLAVLLGAELALARGRWVLLGVAVSFIGAVNPFYLYLCAVFLGCYAPTRLIWHNGWRPGPIVRRSLLLAGIALLGATLGAAITLPYLKVILNSPRGSGAINTVAVLTSLPVFKLESAGHYATALLRFFANDLAGAGDAYRGWQNYLEAPLSYCGLICLLLFPQIFLGGSRRHRLIASLFLLWLIIPTLFPWFRYLFWLFKGDYYRAYSLFSVLGIVILSLLAFRRYMARGAFSMGLLIIWAGILIGVLYLPVDALQSLIDSRLRLAVAVYLALYTIVLVAGEVIRKQTVAAYVVLALTSVELVHFNSITVAERKFLRKDELINGLAVRAETVNALGDLKKTDGSFFRTTVLHSLEGSAVVDPNDSMLLGYYGTSSYASFNDLNYIRFLAALEAIPSNRETDTRWAAGLIGNFIPSLFAGEKYALVENPEPFQQAAQYELIRTYGNSSLFRNAFSLPLGLTFDRYLPEKEFLELPRDGKEQVLLAAAIVDSDSTEAFSGMKAVSVSDLEKELAGSSVPAIVEQRRAGALKLTSFAQNKIEGDLRVDSDSLLVLQMPFSDGWRAFQNGQPVATVRADAGLLGVPVKAGQHQITLRYRNPWLLAGVGATGISLLVLIVAFWRKPRLAISIA